MWGFAGHPLIDGERLICLVGGKGSVAVAFNKDTGKEIWKALSAREPGYAPPMIYEIGGKRELIVWHPEGVAALDPVTGAVHWTQQYGTKKFLKAALSIPTPRLDKDKLFLTAFYDGPLMLQVNSDQQPRVLCQGQGRSEQADDTDGLHSIMSTPFFKDGYIYGVCSYGELRCIDEATGKRLWATHQATTGKSVRWGNAFLVEQGDRFIPLQRARRSDHRQADAEGISGDRPREHPDADEHDGAPQGTPRYLVSSSVRESLRVCAQRQGNRLRLDGGVVQSGLAFATSRKR